LLNELRREWFKKFAQTLIYVPHFISMVIVVGITYIFLTTSNGGGMVNTLLINSGLIHNDINFLSDPHWFRPLIIIQAVWKDCGWGTIIFLAALSGVDVEQYEAAIVDGANRWQQIWHITLPAIKSTVIILLILRMGSVLNNGFEQIFLMTNPLNTSVGDVFDTYVYKMGITQGSFSYSTAVGLFKSLIGIILIYSSDLFAKKAGESGLF
jgi:putative aldouronate transport system permease protein